MLDAKGRSGGKGWVSCRNRKNSENMFQKRSKKVGEVGTGNVGHSEDSETVLSPMGVH
jgi:hypothetical protein